MSASAVADYWAEKQAIKDAHRELEEDIPIRAFRVLWYVLTPRGLKVTPENVAGLTAGRLLREPNFGPKSLADVERWLAHYGRRLGDRGMLRRFKVSLHTTEGEPCSSGGSMRLLADALDVLHT